jgi:hypothetical protein
LTTATAIPGTPNVFITPATRASKLAGRTEAAAGGVAGAGIRSGGRTEGDGVRGFAAVWGAGAAGEAGREVKGLSPKWDCPSWAAGAVKAANEIKARTIIPTYPSFRTRGILLLMTM